MGSFVLANIYNQTIILGLEPALAFDRSKYTFLSQCQFGLMAKHNRPYLTLSAKPASWRNSGLRNLTPSANIILFHFSISTCVPMVGRFEVTSGERHG